MRKSLLKTVVATAIVGAVMTVSSVVAWAAVSSQSDNTTLTGNSPAPAASNCTITSNSTDGTITYFYDFASNAVSNEKKYTGLSIVDVDSNKCKFSKQSSKITFTTDGTFDIIMGDDTDKTTAGLQLKKSGETSYATLTASSSGRQKTGSELPAGTYEISSSDTSSYLRTLTITVKASATGLSVTPINPNSSFNGTFSIDDKVNAETTTLVTLKYTGNDYYIADRNISVSDLTPVVENEETVGYTYDVSGIVPTDSDKIIYTVSATCTKGSAENFSISPENGDYTTSFTVSYNGDDYSMDPQTVTVNTEGATVSHDGKNGTITIDLSSAMTSTTPSATVTVNTNAKFYYWTSKVPDTSRSDQKTSLTIENINNTPIIYVGGVTGYAGKEVVLTEGTNNVTLTALPTTAIDTGKAIATPAIVKDEHNLTIDASYTNPTYNNLDVNGFKFSNVYIQYYDNSNNEAVPARFNVSKDKTIKYTPSTDGIIKIKYASGSNNNSRGFKLSCENADDITRSTSSNEYSTEIFEVESNKEYTFTVTGGAINISEISFAEKTIANIVAPIKTSANDFYTEGTVGESNYAYIIHGVTDDELKGDVLALKDVKYGTEAATEISNISTEKVYKSVKFADNSTVEAGKGEFANYKAIYAIGFDNFIETDGLTLTWEATNKEA